MFVRCIALAVLLSFHSLLAWANAPVSRTALVIGNSAYAQSPLKNPRNDAKAIAAQLNEYGFDVVPLYDGNRKEMQVAVQHFKTRLSKGGVALIYYAGHGVQLNGTNYLIPVDENIQSETDVQFSGIPLDLLLEDLKKSESNLNMIILDACRNNPFAGATRSGTRGLARVNTSKMPTGSTLVMFATSANSVAEDGEGINGLFTKHFLRQLRTPGQEVVSLFRKTMKGVKEESGGKQIPELSLQFYDEFYFTGKPTSDRPMLSPEQQFWEGIKKSDNYADFEDYLVQFPNGTFKSLAQRRFDELIEKTKIAATPPHKDNAIVFRFSNPLGSVISIEGEQYKVTEQLQLYLSLGNTVFSLTLPGGEVIYGKFDVMVVDDLTKMATFGAQETLPKQTHINAALSGAPVFYKLGSNIGGKRRQVVSYILSLRPL